MSIRFASLLLVVMLAGRVLGADPFAENVRSTPPRSPEEQRGLLHAPEGFGIQLVTCEPDIAKPMNLAFDARGRLWVSVSREYPFPAPATQPARDSIKIFEDFDPATGRARKMTTFADHLNIPIGIYPYKDGVIAYSIPKISFYRDTDNDGVCDKVEQLIGDFGYVRDTHGMASNFRRGFDGFIYACHGFNNHSEIKGTDGRALELDSGNTFRFQPDGTRLEQFTWGQTNPFGLSFDPRGNAYTSDSHSKPIYQLLRNGYYEGIGKNHEGLGFAPAMMQHLHGSTAIAGLCILADERWPENLKTNILVGNVITSRINRDAITFNGSSPVAHEQKDFVTSEDPWFRPNNTILGPDGALYVADFYNRIIGHYEVPLDHPGRDRERGRIWRIVPRNLKSEPRPDLTSKSADELIALLDHPNFTLRMLAMDQLTDRIGQPAIEPLRKLVANVAQPPSAVSPTKTVHTLWTLYRLGALQLDDISKAAKHSDPLVRIHAARILAETNPWTSAHHELAIAALSDSDALVQRCAADALGQHPNADNIQPLLALLDHVAKNDSHLRHTIRIALKSQLQTAGYATLQETQLNPKHARELADISLAVQTPDAARFLAGHLDLFGSDRNLLSEVVRHVAKLSGGTGIDPLVKLARERFADDSTLQLELLHSIGQGVAEHGGEASPAVRDWALHVAGDILRQDASTGANRWTSLTLDGAPAVANIFAYEPRRCADGVGPTPFLSSFPGGERQTGILRSAPFKLPSHLGFYLAGQCGFPGTNPGPKNVVRLRDVQADKVLAEAPVPRNDVAQQIVWDQPDNAGKQTVLEIVDGDDSAAWAWIAIARIEPNVVALPPGMGRITSVAQLASAFKLVELTDELKKVAAAPATSIDHESRLAAASALLALGDNTMIPQLAKQLDDASLPPEFREKVASALGQSKSPDAATTLIAALGPAPQRLQTAYARALAGNLTNAQRLLDCIEAGKAPPRLLLDRELRDRLTAVGIPNLDDRIAKLTKGTERPSAELVKLIARRRAAFKSANPSPQNGAAVFTKNCAVCHQIDGQGAIVGPQLNGISKRGLDRVIEDILDPNRNVDPSFRYSTIILKDNKLITGLQRKTDGQAITFTDTTGKEVTVRADQIKKRIESTNSLMPGNFGEVIPPADLNDLLSYLLSK